ncbi:hypothetical protein FB45DRAFT_866069 [Roridomyces roridus]|uniref:Uncharacterized protein n=1 Tax=Roridomyces roridus TaxID=1738132 RepID=A0AAD7BWB8_9AGAR|nr:hypothetical protein FB45DRAFT_866069 [Roridomyces roridus]
MQWERATAAVENHSPSLSSPPEAMSPGPELSSVQRTERTAHTRKPYSSSPSQSRNRSGSVNTQTAILHFLQTRTPPIPESHFLNAKFISGTHASLVAMVRNHGSMERLLQAFSLGSDRTIHFLGPANKSCTLSAAKILNGCAWSESTYGNKATKYHKVRTAAKMKWKGPIPGEGSEVYPTYRVWKGAVFLWSEDGPIATGIQKTHLEQ